MSALTKPQLRMLRDLTFEPQPVYGCSVVRVQNTLVGLRLAEFVDDKGVIATSEWANRCRITSEGRSALAYNLHPLRRSCRCPYDGSVLGDCPVSYDNAWHEQRSKYALGAPPEHSHQPQRAGAKA